MAIFSDTDGTHAGHTTLKKGDKGEEVKQLQQLLNFFYGSILTVDGNFGSKTDALVKQFQADRKLTVDGIVGSKTWSFLEQPNYDV